MSENSERSERHSENRKQGSHRRGERPHNERDAVRKGRNVNQKDNRSNEERGNDRPSIDRHTGGNQNRGHQYYPRRGGYRRGNSNRGPYSRAAPDERKKAAQVSSSEDIDWRADNVASQPGNMVMQLEHLAASASVSVTSQAAETNGTQRSDHSKRRPKLGAYRTRFRYSKPEDKEENDESQREILEELLRKGEYECMVCCEEVRVNDAVWNCSNCYNIFHLKCIKQWALSNGSLVVENGENAGWRCPACQNIEMRVPSRYYCFCGKIRDPDLNHYLVPHSCGNVCRKKKVSQFRSRCAHNCNIQCHPGPCPPCQVRVTKPCSCGKTVQKVKCEDSHKDITCGQICNKPLSCGKHYCNQNCHSGTCDACNQFILQSCFCGQDKRTVQCSLENVQQKEYCCGEMCSKKLNCGNHNCELICHSGECEPCKDSPDVVTHCPCGKVLLKQITGKERTACTDEIRTCGNKCDKALSCGPKDDPHKCRKICHRGPCSVCNLKTVIRCKCGANSENVECKSIANNGGDNSFLCKRRCNKKLSCGRHKCLVECCTQQNHDCSQICGKKLGCGQHTCIEVCHKGPCPSCWNVSWEDLTCHCGAAIKYPPIACGTTPPECNRVCRRRHNCQHRVDHTCHNEPTCPPCATLVSKMCYGGHQECDNVFCYLDGVSCGKTCSRSLSCGIHECQKVCHFGDCGDCTLTCNIPRSDCGHPCGLRCHQLTSKACPTSQCKIMLTVHCPCGRRTDKYSCHKVNDESNRRIPFTLLASIKNQSNESIDVTELISKAKENKLCRLECDEVCSVMERNRRLAEALNITEADLSPDPGPPNYSEFLKQMARENPAFLTSIYNSLVDLVKDAKQTKLNFKNLNFPPMRSDQRQTLHELSEFFGCKSHAVDREPHRSVIVKAIKDKCYLPSMSVMELVKQEDDKKNPKMAIERSNENMVKTAVSCKVEPTKQKAKEEEKVIDYFDFAGD